MCTDWYHETENYRLEYKPRVFSNISLAEIEGMVGEWDSKESTKVRVPYLGYVPIPRDQCSFGDASYSFAGHTSAPRPWTPLMLQLRAQVCKILKLPDDYFTFALVNLYRNGNDSISPHKDNNKQLDPEAPIVSVSLGTRRKFIISWPSKTKPSRKEFMLGEGDLLAMWPPTNDRCMHYLPKDDTITTKRISITFRRVL